ncbi:MAG TPA: type III-A CRISPR-associated RAMP protein Csm4 [Candidatus Alectryocaccomicrobium excrementavium]|uniref:CRISPR system Cms protein Csm4 n=1 Tax=Candidatus Alectryocaccomicrobium excrementavium TaxID=2840668 RepID=A0A9D1G1S3_9FIRM|nr:type III-A CRISPR-associated RAMP protein Csm4 [Candidatus Alectryocaccomicrobium excrementavium]
MNFNVYKLRFTAPVHFGGDNALSLESAQMHFCADTLFSALCHAALLQGGNEAVERLCATAAAGDMRLSDGMPWAEDQKGDQFYLPRPFLAPIKRVETSPDKRKEAKKLRYLPAAEMEKYLSYLRGEGSLDFKALSRPFGAIEERTRAAVPEGGETVPYFVGAYRFEANCGLYFLLGYEDAALEGEVHRLLKLLQFSGIGGKISSGFGKFRLESTIKLESSSNSQTEWLAQALRDAQAPVQITLSACLPAESELESALEGAQYQMIRRGGFIHNPADTGAPRKKRGQCVFQAGSSFRARFGGELSAVGTSAGQTVYRYNRPLWLGVKL